MNRIDPSGRLLAVTMKELFPPRVELDRMQYEMLQRLCEKTGLALKDVVRLALDRYLRDSHPQSDRAVHASLPAERP